MSRSPTNPPQPNDGRPPAIRFDDAMSTLLSVPKSEIDKRLAEEKKAKEAKKKSA